MNFGSTWLRLGVGALFLFAAARCSSSASQNPPKGPTSTVVGASGGTVASGDGALEVSIPHGALPANVTITVTPTTSPGGGALGTVYEIGPSGTTFAQPVTMTFHYDGVSLGGQTAANLRPATYISGAWYVLSGFSTNLAAKTVSGTTTHLSTYALWAPPSTTTSSSGGACASVEAVACGSSGSSGSSSGSSSGGVPGCTTPTCAGDSATLCAGYPGASVQSCADNASGYTADCCFAPGKPLCFAMTGPVNCSFGGSSGSSSGGGTSSGSSGGSGSGSTSSGGSGSGGGTVCTAATCAESAGTLCAQYPGATTSCVDNANGYQASCCFGAGAPVCVQAFGGAECSGSSGSSGGGGSGSSSGSSSGVSCGPTPTCASSTPCAGFPGTTVQSCTDGPGGYTASCCYPVGTLPQPQGGSGGPTLSGSGGSGGGSGGSSSGSSSGSFGGSSSSSGG